MKVSEKFKEFQFFSVKYQVLSFKQVTGFLINEQSVRTANIQPLTFDLRLST